jgi:single-strand DNA-binding protein
LLDDTPATHGVYAADAAAGRAAFPKGGKQNVMSGSLNRAMLIGHLGNAPEGRNGQGGSRIVTFSLATSERWTDERTGQRQERTEWHRVVIFNPKLGELAEKYLEKGSKVFIEGIIRTRKWQDKEGADRYSTSASAQGV